MTNHATLRATHRDVPRRVLGFQRRADHTNLSFAKAFKKANCEGIETKIRKRRLFFAGAITPSDDASAASRLWGNLGSGGQLKDRHRCLVADLVAFQSTEGSTEHSQLQFGVKAVLLVHAASMAGKWYRGALEAAERFMARWHEEKA